MSAPRHAAPQGPPRRLVLVAYYLPWSSSVGSRRPTALAERLAAQGWEVTVVGARPPSGAPSVPPGVRVVLTPQLDRVLAAKRLLSAGRTHRRAPVAPSTLPAVPAPGEVAPFRRRWRELARGLVAFPDTMWEWGLLVRLLPAVRTIGRADVVVATAPPMAALVLGRWLARRAGCPLVLDLRDLWTGDPYRRVPGVLRPLDRWLERRTLRAADRLVTVADGLAEELRVLAPATPVDVIANGFDERWLRRDESHDVPPRLVFTGSLVDTSGRDPGALVEALRRLAARDGGADGAPSFRFDVYGPVSSRWRAALTADGLARHVALHGEVPAERARAAQHGAAVLVNIPWEDDRERDKLPAKLFEYAAAGRPVLHLGTGDNLGRRFLERLGIATVVDPADAAAMERSITSLLDGSMPFVRADDAALAQHGHAAMVERWAEVLDAVCPTLSETSAARSRR